MAEYREAIVNFLNKYLNSEKITDVSRNGLQVEGIEKVSKVVFGVSAGLELFKKAAAKNADMIVVHHGLIWDKPFKITGYVKRRIKTLMDNNINLLAYHLPLDKHPRSGNNMMVLKYLNAQNIKPFGLYEGNFIGYKGILKKHSNLKNILKILKIKLDANSKFAAFGPEKIKSVGVVTGNAPFIINQAIEEKLDLFITGESTEYFWELCRENKLNCITVGHYNSEKAGVLALADVVGKRFKVKTEFIDIANPF